MNNINWQQYGLRKNPYDTFPLVEGGDVQISKAFVGRESERNFLDKVFESNDRLCLTICGDVGVGKTSLANFQKFIWKYNKQKLLFSFRREIEANIDLLNKKSFLIELLGSFLREIRLLQPALLKDELLKKISQIVDLSQTLSLSGGVSVFGFGLDAGGERSISSPVELSTVVLEGYFTDLIDFIKNHEINGFKYSGIIVHVNNFDIVLSNENSKKAAINFFNEVRDILQIKDVYFLFLGPKDFFKEVISIHQRVKSIFYQSPLLINPLSKTEIIKAFEERMELLKSDNIVSYIKPIDDDVVYKVYDLHNGDIRSIMANITDILGQYSEKLAKTLSVDEALLLLGKERWNMIENVMKLTTKQKTILKYLATAEKWISQKEVGLIFHQKQANVSGYYFKPLIDNNIIEEKERVKKVPYYGLTADYIPLKFLVKSQEAVNKSIDYKSGQLELF